MKVVLAMALHSSKVGLRDDIDRNDAFIGAPSWHLWLVVIPVCWLWLLWRYCTLLSDRGDNNGRLILIVMVLAIMVRVRTVIIIVTDSKS